MSPNPQLQLPNSHMTWNLYSKESYNINNKFGSTIQTGHMVFPGEDNHYVFQQLENEPAILRKTIKNPSEPQFIDLVVINKDEKVPFVINKGDQVGYMVTIPSNIDPN